jgi:hypothetical protein
MHRLAFLVALLAACTVVNHALPSAQGQPGVFVTAGDTRQPYESLGPVQVTRKGVLLFGFADPAGTDLDAGMADLAEEARRMGADGVINVRFQQTQYLPATRVLFAILFIVPLPSECTLTGEAIKLRAVAPLAPERPSL